MGGTDGSKFACRDVSGAAKMQMERRHSTYLEMGHRVDPPLWRGLVGHSGRLRHLSYRHLLGEKATSDRDRHPCWRLFASREKRSGGAGHAYLRSELFSSEAF